MHLNAVSHAVSVLYIITAKMVIVISYSVNVVVLYVCLYQPSAAIPVKMAGPVQHLTPAPVLLDGLERSVKQVCYNPAPTHVHVYAVCGSLRGLK